MNRIKSILLGMALVFGALTTSAALAQHAGGHTGGGWHGGGGNWHGGGGSWHGGGGWHGGGHFHGYSRFGLFVGAPLFWPWYVAGPAYYPGSYYYDYYDYPTVVTTPSEPMYIERESAPMAAPAPASGDWYYCAESKAYYPYVKQCASPWQRVAPQPPGAR